MTLFQLIQCRAAIRCEKVGMKHSSGRSAKAAVCRELGISIRTPHQEVLDKLKLVIDTLLVTGDKV